MGTVSFKPEAASRSIGMLRTAMGAITSWLDNPTIVEVMLNPDSRLWIDRLAVGLSDTGKRLSAEDGERIVRVVAHHVGAEVHPKSPRVSAELPVHGERFEGLLPPIVAAPTFAIRKPAVAIFTLMDYVKAGIVTAEQAEFLRGAVAQRRNILVAGGTSTGKTTLVNALLAEVAGTADRVILIEDTRELQCRAPNLVALRTKDGVASLSDLVRSSLRLRPDRIPVGEVRGEGKRNNRSLNSEMTRRPEGSLNAEERLADLVGGENNVQLFRVLGGAIALIEAETGRPWEDDAKTWMRVSNSIQAILNGFRFFFFQESERSPGTRAAPSRRLLQNLEAAMRRDFKAGRIWNEPHGKPSLKRFRIALK
jgi:P-type conjugative transfer ATPase TrbB